MSDLYDMFDEIRKRPEVNLGGRSSIYDIQSFYLGFSYARIELGLEESVQEKDFLLFNDWVKKELDVETNMPWAHTVNFRSTNDNHAVRIFFELLDKFISREEDSLSE
jgi:hypothetical protein